MAERLERHPLSAIWGDMDNDTHYRDTGRFHDASLVSYRPRH